MGSVEMSDNHLTTTICVGRSELVLNVQYAATPGERQVRYYRDGSGYPGSAAEVECLSVRVERWEVFDEDRRRGSHWVWEILDRIARQAVDNQWDRYYRNECLEHAEKKAEW